MLRRLAQTFIVIAFAGILFYILFGGTTNEEVCAEQGRKYVKVGTFPMFNGKAVVIIDKMECK